MHPLESPAALLEFQDSANLRRCDGATRRRDPLPPAARRAASLLVSSGLMARPDSRIVRSRLSATAPQRRRTERLTTAESGSCESSGGLWRAITSTDVVRFAAASTASLAFCTL